MSYSTETLVTSIHSNLTAGKGAAAEMAGCFAQLGHDAPGALGFLVGQCAERSWKDTDAVARVGRMCGEVAQGQNKQRGRLASAPRAVAGSTRLTVVRDYCTAVKAGEAPAAAWDAVKATADLGATGAGGRPQGTSSDAADAFASLFS